jgi:hypothetical protein
MALAIAIVAALMWMKHEHDADTCRKSGGQWDNAASACILVTPAAGSREG